MEEFGICLEGIAVDDAVNADIAMGQELGVSGTPTFLVNGELHVGVLDSLRFEILFEELHDGQP